MENKIQGKNNSQLQNFAGNFLIRFFRIKSIVPILFGLSLFYLIFYTSCANIGSPVGGPKDTIPPVVVKTIPELRSTNFKGTDVRFTFDEFIVPDEIREKLVISPPMKKKPVIKMKGKTLIVEFPEELRKSATYSLDFKDAVADNNEKNPIEDMRFSFSTGEIYDSLRVSGFVKNALNQEPVENALVVLHQQNEYTAFVDSLPNYIGNTNIEGFFMIDNIAQGSYRLYALADADNSLTYNSKAEKIAFADSLIIPSAKFVNRNDTVVQGQDTLLITGHTDYLPGTQNLLMFAEEYFDQYLDASKRNQNNKCEFFFSESLSDSFQINLIKPHTTGNWNFIEKNLKRDSITVWLTDTVISNKDSLNFELRYEVLDSLNQLVVKRDTIELIYASKNKAKPKRKKDEKPEIPTITLGTNINTSAHNLYERIQIEAPEPLQSFDLTRIRLYSLDDTVKTQIPIVVEKDSNSIRKYYIEHLWKPDSRYVFQIDSAAARNIYGFPNKKIDERFKTQKEEYYAEIFLTISGLQGPAIVQLLANDKDEKVLQKIQILEDGKIQFPFLKPDKYKIRLILDPNQNGLWDTGFLADNLQPEAVVYFPKIIKVKSNFEYKEDWKIKYDSGYKKELIDEDLEKEKTRKKEQTSKTDN
jgi:hypothetical protein